MKKKETLFLALGSNLGDREKLLTTAVDLLSQRVGKVVQVSSLLNTEPEGFCSEHLFLNQVVQLETTLSPKEVLQVTQEIEQELGRTSKSDTTGYTDRTCDIDIILYGDLILQDSDLTIPHPRFRERLFVLQPLAEICPKCVDPISGKTIEELLWLAS